LRAGARNDYVCALACSADGKRLAATTDSGELALWSFESGQLIGSWEGAHLKREINALAFQPYSLGDQGPTELLVSGGNDGVVRFWPWVLDLAPCYQIEIGTAITALSFVARNRLAVATASGLV
jgi:WD40 repeat protein